MNRSGRNDTRPFPHGDDPGGARDHRAAAEWSGWSPRGAFGRGPRHDRVDRGPTQPADRDELARRDFEDTYTPDFAGRDSEAYYARHGRNQDDLRARRRQQARWAEQQGDDRSNPPEIDHEYHLRQGPHMPDSPYAPAPSEGFGRRPAIEAPGEGGFAEPSYGSSPTRQAEDHRGKGPRGWRRSDSRIVEDLHERLTDDPVVDASAISVECTDGVVCLSGEVDARYMKYRAEDIAAVCPGVQDVDNRLRVTGQGQPRIGHWP